MKGFLVICLCIYLFIYLISIYSITNFATKIQQVEDDIRYQKRMAAIDLQNIRINISDLTQTRDQLQQTVDGLGEEMMNRSNENKRLEEFAYRFKMSNENYLKIKDVAKEHLTNLLTNAEPDKKALLQIALNSIVLALNAIPYRYEIIFNSNSMSIKKVY